MGDGSVETCDDTHPAIEALRLQGYRQMTAAQKLQIVSQLTLSVQRLALARIRRQHPTANEREQQLRLASLRLDRETMVRVFSWDPEVEGF